jgi:serine phosphatase RsbU (regulator of sigma subunit)
MDRILIVEDDPSLLRGLVDNLRAEPYDVLTATDGEMACRLIRLERPDLIVLDLTLPRIDGLEVCRRARDEGVRTPIVMLTSRNEEGDRVRGLDLGADDYISKPFSLAELLARVRGILHHRREWLVEQTDLRHELRDASIVQRCLLPRGGPAVPGLEYAGVCQPARVIGGDYFDYFEVAPGRLALTVADVSGKGAPAALLMATLQGSVRTNGPAFPDRCEAVVGSANALLCATTEMSRYATMFYGVYEAETRRFTFVNAGHVAALVVNAAGEAIDLDSSARPIGLFDGETFEARSVPLPPGSWLIIFSDGVTEATNDRDEEFGRDRLATLVRRCADGSPAAMCEAIVRAVADHGGGRPAVDDLTVVAAHVAPLAPEDRA